MRQKTGSRSLLGLVLAVPLILLLILNVVFTIRWQSCDTVMRPVYRDPVYAPVAASSRSSSTYQRSPLLTIAGSSQTLACPKNLQFRNDRPEHTGEGVPRKPSDRRIPRIIHQTSKSRCLAPSVFKVTEKWNLEGWEYYLHDDQAIARLFAQEAVHFPLLPLISKHCLIHGTLKADLWRYIVLWVYGGIYADLDAAPNALEPETTIGPNDDALFVVEQFHMLSQYFMAVTPRHPLMWYAIQLSLQNLLDLPDTGKVSAAMVTGPHALHLAYIRFRADAGQRVDPATPGYKPVWAGNFGGSLNYTVTVIGVGENQNAYVYRDLLTAHEKMAAYKRMGMRHFQQDKKFPTGQSCLSTALQGSYKAQQ